MKLKGQLWAWATEALASDGLIWLEEQKIQYLKNPNLFFVNFSLCSRKIEAKGVFQARPLSLSKHDSKMWIPKQWNAHSLARALMLSSFPEDLWLAKLEEAVVTADHGESLDIYRLLPICQNAHREACLYRLSEGLRTNVQPIFEAAVLDSPLPADLLDEELWNHMILKAFHVGVDVAPIQGKSSRRNEALDLILLGFASEKALGARFIAPSLWDEIQNPPTLNFCTEVRRLMSSHPNNDFRCFLNSKFGASLCV